MHGKRTMLMVVLGMVGTLVLATFAIAYPTTATATLAAGEATAPELEGTWLVMVSITDGPPPFPSLVTYARGGALMVTDSSTPPALGNVYQGTWIRKGAHRFAFTFLGFQYDAEGVFINYIRVRETIRLDSRSNTYTGVTIIELLDPAQNVIETISATTQATRVTAP